MTDHAEDVLLADDGAGVLEDNFDVLDAEVSMHSTAATLHDAVGPSVLKRFSSPVPVHVHAKLVAVLCLQLGEAQSGDLIDSATINLLFRLAPLIRDRHHLSILDLKFPELRGFTPVSTACHLNGVDANVHGDAHFMWEER